MTPSVPVADLDSPGESWRESGAADRLPPMTRRDDAIPASPTADQITISGGGTEAVIVTLGAALRTLTQDGSPLVDGFSDAEPIPYGRGQLCIPWPNRIGKGRYTWDGVRDPGRRSTSPAGNAALHGLVRWAIWDVRSHEADRVVLGYRLCPQDGYPFLVDFEIDYAVSRRRAHVDAHRDQQGRRCCAVRVRGAPLPAGRRPPHRRLLAAAVGRQGGADRRGAAAARGRST